MLDTPVKMTQLSTPDDTPFPIGVYPELDNQRSVPPPYPARGEHTLAALPGCPVPSPSTPPSSPSPPPPRSHTPLPASATTFDPQLRSIPELRSITELRSILPTILLVLILGTSFITIAFTM